MSEKEKNIVPSTAEAEMSEEEKQKLLEQFDKESKTRKFGSPVLKKAYRVFAIIVTLYHLVFASGLYLKLPVNRSRFQLFDHQYFFLLPCEHGSRDCCDYQQNRNQDF